VTGPGEPLVVFEAGIGVGASVWVTVQPLVAAETRTLKRSFDGSRPGRHAMPIPRRDSSWPAVKSSHELFSYLTECVYAALPQ
jgi:hypothetical protein